MNAKYLRYPGGWKSDILFWSRPPYVKPDPYLVYKGPGSWPSSDTSLVNPDGSWRIDPYDFDEFIEKLITGEFTTNKTDKDAVIKRFYRFLREADVGSK
jgi:hypothetical protein